MRLVAGAQRARQLGRKAIRRTMPRLGWRVRPAILMYHRIDEDVFDPWGLCVAPSLFDAQMQWLASNRTVVPLSEFAELHRRKSLPPAAAAITFDDGYASAADSAAPTLERLQLPATVFVPPRAIEGERPYWWDELANLILGFAGEILTVHGEAFELGPPEADEWTWRPNAPPRTARQELFWRTWAGNRTRPIEEIEELMGELRTQVPTAQRTALLMTPAQVRTVNTANVKIGSHALTHSSLPSLSFERKREEIHVSIERCEALTGERPATFAYPFGDYDEETQSIVMECGFACGCTTEGKAVGPRAEQSRLPRIGVGNWAPETLERVLLEI